MGHSLGRRGVSLVEVIVVLVLFALIGLGYFGYNQFIRRQQTMSQDQRACIELTQAVVNKLRSASPARQGALVSADRERHWFYYGLLKKHANSCSDAAPATTGDEGLVKRPLGLPLLTATGTSVIKQADLASVSTMQSYKSVLDLALYLNLRVLSKKDEPLPCTAVINEAENPVKVVVTGVYTERTEAKRRRWCESVVVIPPTNASRIKYLMLTDGSIRSLNGRDIYFSKAASEGARAFSVSSYATIEAKKLFLLRGDNSVSVYWDCDKKYCSPSAPSECFIECNTANATYVWSLQHEGMPLAHFTTKAISAKPDLNIDLLIGYPEGGASPSAQVLVVKSKTELVTAENGCEDFVEQDMRVSNASLPPAQKADVKTECEKILLEMQTAALQAGVTGTAILPGMGIFSLCPRGACEGKNRGVSPVSVDGIGDSPIVQSPDNVLTYSP